MIDRVSPACGDAGRCRFRRESRFGQCPAPVCHLARRRFGLLLAAQWHPLCAMAV